MRNIHTIIEDANIESDAGMAVFGTPRGDELPQVAGVEDILMDVYSDILNMPLEYAAGHFHHQYVDELDEETYMIH